MLIDARAVERCGKIAIRMLSHRNALLVSFHVPAISELIRLAGISRHGIDQRHRQRNRKFCMSSACVRLDASKETSSRSQ